MPNIGSYLASVQIILVEFGKYFAVLLLAVLALRNFAAFAYAPAAYWLNDFLLAKWPGEKILFKPGLLKKNPATAEPC